MSLLSIALAKTIHPLSSCTVQTAAEPEETQTAVIEPAMSLDPSGLGAACLQDHIVRAFECKDGFRVVNDVL